MATSNIFKSPKVTKLIRFDWFMKYMLRDKSNFDILEGFLSELLKEDIKIIEIIESESNKQDKKDKFNRVDILVKTKDDERVIVEIQNNTEFDFLQRILFGACKTIVENMRSGDSYDTIKKVISISIVYFSIAQGEDYIYLGQTQFKGMHLNDTLTLLPEQQELFDRQSLEEIYPNFYLIKAGDFKGEQVKNTLDEWIYFFKTGDVKEGFSAKGLDKAKKKLEVAKMYGKKRKEYESYEDSLHSEASYNMQMKLEIMLAERKAEARGEARGKEEGKEEGKSEIVIRLHLKGKKAEEISDLTDISLEKVVQIIADYDKNV